MSDESDGTLDEAIDALPENRLMIAFDRAWKKIGYVDLDDPSDNPDFIAAFERELITMVMADTMASLQEKGMAEVDHVGEDGEIYYKLTPLGEEVANAAKESDED